MEDFFSQYGKVIIAIVVVAVLLIIVGTSGTTGLAGVINNAFKEVVTKFTGIFNGIKIPGV